MKAAVLVGDPNFTGLVAVSLYDSKPVYLISNACDKVGWTKKERKLWHKDKGKKVNVPFFRLNIIDQYNHGMGNVDQADQLRLQYRSTYWLRNRKWWWSIFFWLFEGALTNSFVLYQKFFQIHDREPPLNHYEYIRAISLAWLDQSVYWIRKKKKQSGNVASSSSQASNNSVISRLRRTQQPKTVSKSTTFTKTSLDSYSGSLRCRLDRHYTHLPERTGQSVGNCQLCYWTSKKRVRSYVFKCSSCQVLLCLDCYKPFHELIDLEVLKNK